MFDAPNIWPICVHESAHAVTASRLGLRVIAIEIRGGSDGLDGWTTVDWSRARPSAWVTVLMAGWAAEEVITGARAVSKPHAGSDKDVITEALAKVIPNQRAMVVTTATQHARRMVQSHRSAIVSLAQVLVANATGSVWDGVNIHLDGERLYEALGGAEVAILRAASG